MDPFSEMLDLYEIKFALFDNVNPEEFLLFISKWNTTLGEALCHFDALYDEVYDSTTVKLGYIVLGLSTYFFLLRHCPKSSAWCTTEQWSHLV